MNGCGDFKDRFSPSEIALTVADSFLKAFSIIPPGAE